MSLKYPKCSSSRCSKWISRIFLCFLKHYLCGVYIMKPVSVFHNFMATLNWSEGVAQGNWSPVNHLIDIRHLLQSHKDKWSEKSIMRSGITFSNNCYLRGFFLLPLKGKQEKAFCFLCKFVTQSIKNFKILFVNSKYFC